MDLYSEVKKLLSEIGPGRMRSTAYDTAWVARLVELDEPIGYEALEWLRENQLPDGSWGAKAPHYHHDRLISTLAAVSALARWGNDRDRNRLLRARLGIDTAIKGLSSDTVGETIGFEMIVPTLLDEAKELGAIERETDGFADLPLTIYNVSGSTITKRKSDNVLDRLESQRISKITKLPKGKISRNVTVAFSSEMVGRDGLEILDIENLQEKNGSISYSPSATAFYAMYIRPGDTSALKYLKDIAEKNNRIYGGGIPNVAPFDTFEPAWGLWNLSLTNILNNELRSLCDSHVEFLSNAWKPQVGIGFTSQYHPIDSDVTSVTFDTLYRLGYHLDVSTILNFEEDGYFRCYDLESNPSISANIHVLGALREAGFDKDHPSVQMLIDFLDESRMFNMFWFDKWHSSPYYPTSHAIIGGIGFIDDMIIDAIGWIEDTQNPNGSWGYYCSTAEETAYCLQALFLWKRSGGRVRYDTIERGLDWLEKSMDPPYQPLWIGKCLYCPELVVRSAVLSALILGREN